MQGCKKKLGFSKNNPQNMFFFIYLLLLFFFGGKVELETDELE